MIELTIEQATAIANKLGTLPANQCYNELTIILQAIQVAENEKLKELKRDAIFNSAIDASKGE
jgi:hypothetical protein